MIIHMQRRDGRAGAVSSAQARRGTIDDGLG